ncbi:MAG TPA: hypothetical protein VFG59_01705 [Anaeromyxobacter sp.]|nr:hypothetical protein [Anaeromyxobacter sp.]
MPLLALLLLGQAAPPGDLPRTYRLTGTARVKALPFPVRDQEIHADAVVRAGPSPGELEIHLLVEGYACDLAATSQRGGALRLAPGQNCRALFSGEEAEGRIEASLASGAGRLDEEALSLELVFTIGGSVRMREGGALDALGQALSLPGSGGSWTAVKGEARGRAEGRRDRSRAAGG